MTAGADGRELPLPREATRMVETFEVPVDAGLVHLMRAYEIHVPTESGGWAMVNVMHNLVRNTYEVEWSAELMDQSPQALTATIQMAMLAIRERRLLGTRAPSQEQEDGGSGG